MLLLYVDDLFVAGTDGLIANRRAEFEMKDLGMMHYFLGMEVWQSSDGIFLGQGKYAIDILKKFGMMDYVVHRLHTSSRNLLKAVSSLEKVGEV